MKFKIGDTVRCMSFPKDRENTRYTIEKISPENFPLSYEIMSSDGYGYSVTEGDLKYYNPIKEFMEKLKNEK